MRQLASALTILLLSTNLLAIPVLLPQPVIATCYILPKQNLLYIEYLNLSVDSYTNRDYIMRTKPKIGYVYALDLEARIVYVSFTGPIRDTIKIDLAKLNQVSENKCIPLIKLNQLNQESKQ